MPGTTPSIGPLALAALVVALIFLGPALAAPLADALRFLGPDPLQTIVPLLILLGGFALAGIAGMTPSRLVNLVRGRPVGAMASTALAAPLVIALLLLGPIPTWTVLVLGLVIGFALAGIAGGCDPLLPGDRVFASATVAAVSGLLTTLIWMEDTPAIGDEGGRYAWFMLALQALVSGTIGAGAVASRARSLSEALGVWMAIAVPATISICGRPLESPVPVALSGLAAGLVAGLPLRWSGIETVTDPGDGTRAAWATSWARAIRLGRLFRWVGSAADRQTATPPR